MQNPHDEGQLWIRKKNWIEIAAWGNNKFHSKLQFITVKLLTLFVWCSWLWGFFRRIDILSVLTMARIYLRCFFSLQLFYANWTKTWTQSKSERVFPSRKFKKTSIDFCLAFELHEWKREAERKREKQGQAKASKGLRFSFCVDCFASLDLRLSRSNDRRHSTECVDTSTHTHTDGTNRKH